MTVATLSQSDELALTHDLGDEFAPPAAAHDADGSLVSENYDILKKTPFFRFGMVTRLPDTHQPGKHVGG
jgi:hypothetical protein